jgi:hypothetical protein
MNPYPLFTLNHFTVPVTLVAEREQLKHQNDIVGQKNCVLAKTKASINTKTNNGQCIVHYFQLLCVVSTISLITVKCSEWEIYLRQTAKALTIEMEYT